MTLPAGLQKEDVKEGEEVAATAFWAHYTFEPKLDKDGEEVLDEDGEPVMEKVYDTLGSTYTTP